MDDGNEHVDAWMELVKILAVLLCIGGMILWVMSVLGGCSLLTVKALPVKPPLAPAMMDVPGIPWSAVIEYGGYAIVTLFAGAAASREARKRLSKGKKNG